MEILTPVLANLQLPLEALVSMDERYLRAHPQTPRLYDAGVRWQAEGKNECTGRPAEEWDAIPIVLERGWGDCEDLAAWRAAELRVRDGFPRARAFAVRSGTMHVAGIGTVGLIHILVSRDGSCRLDAIEDPSQRLGMAPIPHDAFAASVNAYCIPQGDSCEAPTAPAPAAPAAPRRRVIVMPTALRWRRPWR